MIKICSTARKYTTRIWRPSWSINSNGYWLFVTSSFKSRGWSWRNISIWWNCKWAFCTTGRLTCSINRSVRIRWFSTNTISNEIFKTIIHQTTFTSIISIRCCTVNELLFREISKSSFIDCISRFTCRNCWESPAWSTLSLIFNTLNITFGYPVDTTTTGSTFCCSCWTCSIIIFKVTISLCTIYTWITLRNTVITFTTGELYWLYCWLTSGFSWFESKIDRFEFFFCKIGEMIFTFGVCFGSFSIMFIYFFHIHSPNSQPVWFFFNRSINFAMLGFEVFKTLIL